MSPCIGRRRGLAVIDYLTSVPRYRGTFVLPELLREPGRMDRVRMKSTRYQQICITHPMASRGLRLWDYFIFTVCRQIRKRRSFIATASISDIISSSSNSPGCYKNNKAKRKQYIGEICRAFDQGNRMARALEIQASDSKSDIMTHIAWGIEYYLGQIVPFHPLAKESGQLRTAFTTIGNFSSTLKLGNKRISAWVCLSDDRFIMYCCIGTC